MGMNTPPRAGPPGMSLKAFVSFQGSAVTSALCTIVKSGNVASVTRGSAIGRYTVAFNNAMGGASTYAIVLRTGDGDGAAINNFTTPLGAGSTVQRLAASVVVGLPADPTFCTLEFWE